MTGFIVIWLICGIITLLIGQKKNMGSIVAFALGALLGVIGIVIMLFLPSQLPKAPKGMYATGMYQSSPEGDAASHHSGAQHAMIGAS